MMESKVLLDMERMDLFKTISFSCISSSTSSLRFWSQYPKLAVKNEQLLMFKMLIFFCSNLRPVSAVSTVSDLARKKLGLPGTSISALTAFSDKIRGGFASCGNDLQWLSSLEQQQVKWNIIVLIPSQQLHHTAPPAVISELRTNQRERERGR